MDLISAIAGCLCGRDDPQNHRPVIAHDKIRFAAPGAAESEKARLMAADIDRDVSESADNFIRLLASAKHLGPALEAKLAQHKREVDALGWWEDVAQAIWERLAGVIETIEKGECDIDVGAIKEALAKVRGIVVQDFDECARLARDVAHEHPVATTVFCCLLAIGVLYMIYPWVLGCLGFAESGVLEGSIAAAWQRTFMGLVPKGSLFSFLQHLGATVG